MKRLATRVFVVSVFFTTLSVLSGACGGTANSVSTTPTPVTTTDTFSGTLAQLGAAVHSFTVAVAGALTIGLTEVGPLATMAIGVGIGSWDGTNCVLMAKNDNARAGSAALSGTAGAGNYCVQVYDSGNIPDNTSVTYTVQVVHP